jgi:hypothetical protein
MVTNLGLTKVKFKTLLDLMLTFKKYPKTTI